MNLVEKFPHWIEEAKGIKFFGKNITEFSRDELFVVIGYLSEEVERWQKENQSMLSFYKRLNDDC